MSPLYMKDASLEETDDSGRVLVRIDTPWAEQQDERSPAHFDHLIVNYYPSAASQWLITANAGTLPPSSQTLNLTGNVQLHGVKGTAANGAAATTEHLDLDLEHKLATNHEAVQIHFGKHVLVAEGLRADLNANTLQLEAKVHGLFAR